MSVQYKCSHERSPACRPTLPVAELLLSMYFPAFLTLSNKLTILLSRVIFYCTPRLCPLKNLIASLPCCKTVFPGGGGVVNDVSIKLTYRHCVEMVLIIPNAAAFTVSRSRMINIGNGRKLSVVGEKENWTKAYLVIS